MVLAVPVWVGPSCRPSHLAHLCRYLTQDFVLGFSGDARVATLRAEEAKQPFTLEYRLPKEGALMYFDLLAVPADAPGSAHRSCRSIRERGASRCVTVAGSASMTSAMFDTEIVQ